MVLSISIIILYGSVYNGRGALYLIGMVLICGGVLSTGVEESFGVVDNKVIDTFSGICNDGLSRVSKGLIYTLSGLCLIGNIRIVNKWEYGAIVILSSFGVGLLVSSKDWMSIYLSLELQSLGMYVLATYKKDSSYSTESGLKYFVVGGFGSGLLLFGSSMMYGSSGSIRLEEIGELWTMSGAEGLLMKIGLGVAVVGLCFKLSAGPYHMWIIDVIEGAPMRTARIFSVVPKIGVLGVLIRVLMEIPYSAWQGWIVWISMISMIVSICGGLYQRKAKRFMAYSGVGHIGYMLMGVSIGSYIDVGIENVMMYMGVYMITGWCIWELLERERIVYIEEIGKIGKRNVYLGVGMSILCFSMAGVPPLVGFYVKWSIFKSVVEGGLWMLSIVGLMCTVVGGYNYLRWIKSIYYEGIVESKGIENNVEDIGRDMSSVILGVGLGLVSIAWIGHW